MLHIHALHGGGERAHTCQLYEASSPLLLQQIFIRTADYNSLLPVAQTDVRIFSAFWKKGVLKFAQTLMLEDSFRLLKPGKMFIPHPMVFAVSIKGHNFRLEGQEVNLRSLETGHLFYREKPLTSHT